MIEIVYAPWLGPIALVLLGQCIGALIGLGTIVWWSRRKYLKEFPGEE